MRLSCYTAKFTLIRALCRMDGNRKGTRLILLLLNINTSAGPVLTVTTTTSTKFLSKGDGQ